MSKVPCMTYKARADWVQVHSWRISGELMKLNPIDRAGLMDSLNVETRLAVERREKQSGE